MAALVISHTFVVHFYKNFLLLEATLRLMLHPSNSNTNMYANSARRLLSSLETYVLLTIGGHVTKRKLPLKQYLEFTNKLINLSPELLRTPNSPLFKEVLGTYSFYDS